MLLIGDAEMIEDQAIKAAGWADGWEHYYPTTGDATDPDFMLLRIFLKDVQGWNRSETFEFFTRLLSIERQANL